MLTSFGPTPAFLGLVFFSTFPTATAAFTPFYSSATQCSPFTVTWGASNVTTGPPFFLLILPLDAPPTIVSLPNSAFDPTTKTGKYALDKLPLKSATQFIVTMDDGYGVFFSPPGNLLSAHTTFSSTPPNRSGYWRCILDPNRRRLV